MRKISFIMMLLFCATSMYAQKGKVTQAISYFTSGKLKEAKEMIDVAIKHEACLNWDKAYFTKGQIYQAIYESENKDYKKLDPNALNVAWDAYQKVIELDVKQKYPKKLATQYQNMIFDFTNQAVGYYNAQNFKDALKSFERVLEIQKSPYITEGKEPKVDTVIMFNAGVAAQKAQEYATAEKLFKETLKYDYEAAKTYPVLAAVLKEQGKEAEAIEYLKKGHEANPDNVDILVELINYYLFGGKPEEAEGYLDAAIKQAPNNPSFYRAKGTLYEKMNKMDQAEEMYSKALEINPKDYIAQFSIGNIKLTAVNELQKKVSAIQDLNEYNKGVEKLMTAYLEVLPYFEKAYELKPEDRNTWGILKELYFRLRNKDAKYMAKFEEFNAKLKGN
nr:MAG TPA: putative lipoprotein [Microviridae sp.]